MATRFYFNNDIDPSLTMTSLPGRDAGWETGSGVFSAGLLDSKTQMNTPETLVNSSATTVPITTTQDIFCREFISYPIRYYGQISGTFSLVIRASESAATANVNLAVVVRVVSNDGGTIRGTLFSVFGTDTEFAVAGSDATRIISAASLTPVNAQVGDRIIVDLGAHATAPTAGTTYLLRWGNSAASDFALTTALTTDLNPWCEFSQDLFPQLPNNYQFVKAGDGMSVSEKIR